MKTETGWLNSRIESIKNGNPIDQFAATISPLTIRQDMAQGNIFAGGCGGGFPERLMLCSPESDFSLLEPTDPSLVLDNPVEKKFSGQKPDLKPGKVTYFPASLQTILPSFDQSSFDSVLFFRIQRLQEQLQEGLYKKLHRVIKPGGYLLGSGSFKGIQECQEIFQGEFDVEQIVNLKNPDYSGYLYFQHLGFVLRKK